VLEGPRPGFVHGVFGDLLRAIRNEIHHTEERVIKGELGASDPLMVRADGPERDHPSEAGQTIKTLDRLRVGTCEITFVQLATALREMSETCERLTRLAPAHVGARPLPSP